MLQRRIDHHSDLSDTSKAATSRMMIQSKVKWSRQKGKDGQALRE